MNILFIGIVLAATIGGAAMESAESAHWYGKNGTELRSVWKELAGGAVVGAIGGLSLSALALGIVFCVYDAIV